MPRLIIVAGSSGAGKTFILSKLSNYRNDIVTIRKYTTRGPRKVESDDETIDLRLSCAEDRIRDCEYTYRYCENSYGVRKSEIDKVLRAYKNPILIVASCNTIQKLKRDYPNALILYVHSGLSGGDLEEQLKKYNDPIDVKERMRRQRNGYNDYMQHIANHFFDYVLINFFDDTFLQQVEYILEKELNDSSDANYIFVIMSFDPRYDQIYDAIKLGGKLFSQLKIERVSEHKGDYIITDRIEASINKAELIICDLTEKSPNVYYELGYARARKKYIILTAQEGTDLPFDIRQYKVNFYENPIQLETIIWDELKHYYNGTFGSDTVRTRG